ncbi:MAG: alpha/beta fold hydrolase [Gammaproteobacteria bacterium]|nr:alpha/beta fold hydrolase [Gammaproteobacteria bacterium]
MSTEPKQSTLHIRTSDNISLAAILSTPFGKASGAALLAHGITVEKNEGGFYTRLATLLARRGIQSLRFDFRGHGESGGRPQDMTINGEVQDLIVAANYLHSLGWIRLSVVGTSFGAGIASLAAKRKPDWISSLVLLAPVLDYRRTFLQPETEWASEWFTPDTLARAKATGELDLDGFSLGYELLKEFETLNPGQVLTTLSVPTLIVHGTDDTMVPFDVAQELAWNCGHARFLPIKGADHGFEDSEEIVFAEVANWILKHI